MRPIELAARAAFEAAGYRWHDANHPEEQRFMEIARAVLLSLREPSEAMVNAGYDADPEGGHFDGFAVWQAMINAALSE